PSGCATTTGAPFALPTARGRGTRPTASRRMSAGRACPRPHPNADKEDHPVLRTHDAGTLRAEHSGQTVTLSGWVARRRDHGGVAFLDLRDASGVAQVVARDEALTGAAHDLRNEYVVKVVGEIAPRDPKDVNPELPTGEVDVVAANIEVLSQADPLPFQIDERVSVGEEARLRHRYLDLRRPGATSAGAGLRLRSKVNAAARSVLAERDFG